MSGTNSPPLEGWPKAGVVAGARMAPLRAGTTAAKHSLKPDTCPLEPVT